MIFKHPHLLYGLLFLLVPIIIHLFQLRRFKKVEFTNVAFLQPLISQTRKSQLLKKWLVLFMRLLAITCLVIAFAQPYFPAATAQLNEKQTVIYLDNSYSMQAAGSKGALYDVAVKELLDNLPQDKVFSLFTNDRTYTNVTKKGIANDLLQATYSSKTLSYEDIQLKAASLLDQPEMTSEFIILSDFQKFENQENTLPFNSFTTKKVQLTPEKLENISIDSVYINRSNNKQLVVQLTANYSDERPVTLTLENKNLLVSKTAVTVKNGEGTALFDLPDLDQFKGRLTIQDQGLPFDNVMYLSFDQSQQINILAINEADDSFLKKIMNDDRFNLISTDFAQANYNLIKEQNFIILNELRSIPNVLINELKAFTNNGGQLLIIPSKESGNYESFITNQKMQVSEVEKKITSINYDHPIFKNVFNKKVNNFQYPSIKSSTATYYATDPILKYDDGSSFLYKINNSYVFTAPINQENSNFQNSPIIVPVLYNMASNSLPLPNLYQHIHENKDIAIAVSTIDDDILKLVQEKGKELIPLQRSYGSYTTINAGDEINVAGNYEVRLKNDPVSVLSFNDLRTENELNYYSAQELGEDTFTDVGELFITLSEKEKINTLWEFFIWGVLFFLLCELLILKFVK